MNSDGTVGSDTITDFNLAQGDKIDLYSYGITTTKAALDLMTDDGSGNLSITINGDQIASLTAISKSDLVGADFLANGTQSNYSFTASNQNFLL